MTDLILAINWNVNPEISLGPLTIRYYGILFAIGFLVGYQVISNIFKNEGKTQKELDQVAMVVIFATVIGARLGHCFFYEPAYYLANPLEILMIWKGGLASHGAAVAILLGLWLYSRKNKNIPFLWFIDRLVIVVAFSGALIRLGNFINSEIYGLPSDLPWAVVFQRIDDIARHPVQLYESLSYLLISFFLYYKYKKLKTKVPSGLLLGYFLTLVFGARFVLEFFKSYQADFLAGAAFDMGQLLSIPFVIAGIILIVRAGKNK
jgi:phosphatidylglycerol---prolipoprotein diacylglyceryl transferase